MDFWQPATLAGLNFFLLVERVKNSRRCSRSDSHFHSGCRITKESAVETAMRLRDMNDKAQMNVALNTCSLMTKERLWCICICNAFVWGMLLWKPKAVLMFK